MRNGNNALTGRLLPLHLHLDHLEARVGRRRRGRRAGQVGRRRDGHVLGGRFQLGFTQPVTSDEMDELKN